jgi:hypothetical protein
VALFAGVPARRRGPARIGIAAAALAGAEYVRVMWKLYRWLEGLASAGALP